MSQLFAEEELVEGRHSGGGAAAGPGFRGAREPAIDKTMTPENRPVASDTPASTVANHVPGGYGGGGGASVRSADVDAYLVSGTAAPAAPF